MRDAGRREDNIPVLSWVALGGRCRGCQARIGIRYPVVEALTAVLFALTAVRLGVSWSLPAELAFVGGIIALAAVDLERYLLPRAILYPTLILVSVGLLIAAAVTGTLDPAGHRRPVRASGAFLAFFAIHYARPAWLGFGDVRLAGLLGLALGWMGPWYLLIGLMAANLAGAVFGVGLILAGKATRHTALPYGVFLGVGCVVRPAGGRLHHQLVLPSFLLADPVSGGRAGRPGLGFGRAALPDRRRVPRPGLVVILEGLPAGLADHRRADPGRAGPPPAGLRPGPADALRAGRLTLIGGVRHGRTLGSPVAIEIANTEWPKWEQEMSPAPGPHREAADPAPARPRRPARACRSTASTTPGTCSSGRRPGRRRPGWRPAPWPKRSCAELGIGIVSHVVQMGPVVAKSTARPGPADLAAVDDSQVRCFDPEAEAAMVAEIKAAAKVGDSLGGVVEVIGYGVPVGLGSHVHWDRRLDGLLAQALMSIQAVKGVEIGEGIDVAGRRGSEAHDPIAWDAATGAYRRAANWSGGIEGGMTNGEPRRGPGGHEAAGHAQPAGAQDRRRGDQGGDGVVQGAHRRHRGAGHGRGGRDDDGAGAGRRGAAQVRRRLGGRGPAQPRRYLDSLRIAMTVAATGAAHRHDGRRKVDDRAPAGRPAGVAVPRQRRRDRAPDRPDRRGDLEGRGRGGLPGRGDRGPGRGHHVRRPGGGGGGRRRRPRPRQPGPDPRRRPGRVAARRRRGAGRRGSAPAPAGPCSKADPAEALAPALADARAPIYAELADLTFDVDRLSPAAGRRPDRGRPLPGAIRASMAGSRCVKLASTSATAPTRCWSAPAPGTA